MKGGNISVVKMPIWDVNGGRGKVAAGNLSHRDIEKNVLVNTSE